MHCFPLILLVSSFFPSSYNFFLFIVIPLDLSCRESEKRVISEPPVYIYFVKDLLCIDLQEKLSNDAIDTLYVFS